MASKSLLLTTAGLFVAGAALVTWLAFSGGEKPSEPDNTKINVEQPAPAKPNRDERSVANAEQPKPSERTSVAPTNQAANATGGIEGTVSDMAGVAIVGARIELVKAPASSGFGQNVLQVMRAQQANPAGAKPESYATVSGADGKFKLLAPPGENWRVLATATDFARAEYSNITTPADGFYNLRVQMKGGVRLYGRVTEHEKNMPLIGARVTLDGEAPVGAFSASVSEIREAITDESGGFKFENVTPGSHRLSIHALTYGTKNFPVIHVPDEQTYRLDAVLMPGYNISGRVLDPNGQSVPNAKVRANTAGVGGSANEATTNELGEFVVTDLEEGRYFLIADAGDLGQGRPDPPTQSIATGSVGVEIKLPLRSGVQGIVRDKATGKPVTSFTVEVRRGAAGARIFPRELGPTKFKDRRDGSFEMPGVDAQGQHILYVTAEGYSGTYSDSFTVQPGQITRGVDVALTVGGTIKGIVLDGKTGLPVSGATVRTRDNEYKDMSDVPLLGALVGSQPQKIADMQAQTDSEGKFEIRHVEEGIVKLQITHPRFVTNYQPDVSVLNGKTTQDISVRLLSGSVVRGTVFGADGAPAANAEVKVAGTGGGIGQHRALFSRSTRADANGKYTIQNIPAGEYFIHAVPSGPNGAAQSPFVGMALAQKSRKPLSVAESMDQEVDLYIPAN